MCKWCKDNSLVFETRTVKLLYDFMKELMILWVGKPKVKEKSDPTFLLKGRWTMVFG